MSFNRMLNEPSLFRICFVCTGNICRSPMADVVFTKLVADAGLSESIGVISAGTGDWHVGEPADERTVTALANHGYDGSRHRARQFDPEWFDRLDLVVAFDHGHERTLKAWATNDRDRSKVRLLLSFDPEQEMGDVPDPYYSDAALFDRVLSMIEKASNALFTQVVPGITRGA